METSSLPWSSDARSMVLVVANCGKDKEAHQTQMSKTSCHPTNTKGIPLSPYPNPTRNHIDMMGSKRKKDSATRGNGKNPIKSISHTEKTRSSYPTHIPEPESIDPTTIPDTTRPTSENAAEQGPEDPEDAEREITPDMPRSSAHIDEEGKAQKIAPSPSAAKVADSLSEVSDEGKSYPSLLVAYPNKHHTRSYFDRILRPCKVVQDGQVFWHWCGFFHETRSDLIYVVRYDEIKVGGLDFRSNDMRNLGIRLEGLYDEDDFTLTFDVSQLDPHNYAPYLLEAQVIRTSHLYIYRLLVSSTLRSRVTARLSVLIHQQRVNGAATMDTFAALAQCWQVRTSSIRGAYAKFPHLLNVAVVILGNGVLLKDMMRAVAECDDEDRNEFSCLDRGNATIDEWLQHSDDTVIYIGAEKAGNDCIDGDWVFHWAFTGRGKKKEKKNRGPRFLPRLTYHLLAYSENTQEDVIRPCVVKPLDGEPFKQWFAFKRTEDDILRIVAYEPISGEVLTQNNTKVGMLSKGIPFQEGLVDRRTGELNREIFRDQAPETFSTYILVQKTCPLNQIYLWRLIASVEYWDRIAERLWWRAVHLDALPAFEMLRLSREAWLQKTSSMTAVNLKLDLTLQSVVEQLRDSQFLDAVLREIYIMDKETAQAEQDVSEKTSRKLESSSDESIDAPDPPNDKATLDNWLRSCGENYVSFYVGYDQLGNDAYRWGYEDWPRPSSIVEAGVFPRGDRDYAAENASIKLVDGYYPESAVDLLLKGHSCESSENLLTPGALWWREKTRKDHATRYVKSTRALYRAHKLT